MWQGKRPPACQDHKRLAVLLMPKVTAQLLGAPLKEPVFFKVPPGSFAALKAYSELLRHEGHPYASVVTRLGFAPDRQFQITFDVEDVLDNKDAPLVLPLLKDQLTQRIIGTQPIIREVKQIDTKPSKVDTGILEAFSGQQEIMTALAEEQKQETEQRQAAKAKPSSNGGNAIPGTPDQAPSKAVIIEDAEPELEAGVAAMLATKVDGMLK